MSDVIEKGLAAADAGQLARLTTRAVVEVAGTDRVTFLQGLVSNDVAEAAPGRAVWAALLTPQGKWLADFFILADPAGERLLLDCEAAQAPMVSQRLSRYRLRSDVTVRVLPAMHVHTAWGGGEPDQPGPDAFVAPDPRLPDAGWRVLSPAPLPQATSSDEAWDLHRLRLGLPDGSRDLESEKTVLLEAGFDELGGVSWRKGCYMGQELTARTKYRGLLKRRLVPVRVDGPLPPPETPVQRDGAGSADAGTMRSGRGDRGLALLRLDALRADSDGSSSGGLACGAARLVPEIPAWMRLLESAQASPAG